MGKISFTNCRLCIGGHIFENNILVFEENGSIFSTNGVNEGKTIDLRGAIICPGFLDLHTNGMLGFHFSHFESEKQYATNLERISRFLITRGVTGFWGTLPTVPRDEYKKILPCLKPRDFDGSASLLGAHVEGPFLHPSKKGAHNAELFQTADLVSAEELYGEGNLNTSVKLVTVAPELPRSSELITLLTKRYGTRVSLGHSSATYEQGIEGVKYGATALTHVFNAMNALHHRNPGLAGLVSSLEADPYYTLIADGIHLHPATLAMAHRTNPEKCIIITDSVELAGLPDGTYEGHAQISSKQEKIGDRVTIQGTDILIGGCASLNKCVENLISWRVCSLAAAVRCVTENVADFMGIEDRGKLESGRRADFTVLDDDGQVLQVWMGGRKVWERGDSQ